LIVKEKEEKITHGLVDGILSELKSEARLLGRLIPELAFLLPTDDRPTRRDIK
jgi:hypothetical protein